MEISTASVGKIFTVLINQPSPVLLLGAGTSVKSGIPLASGVVERVAKWAFARENGRSPEDPTLQRSDWLPWLKQHAWYSTESSLGENYHVAVEQLLQPRQDRSDFFIKLINPGVEPSIGYEKLAEFMHLGFVHTVLTTNFDETLSRVRLRIGRPHHLDLIRTGSDYTKFSTSPSHPQLVYLHGSVEHYTDLNILKEVQELDESLVRMLLPLLRDHPLIVVGYRGGEPSVMRHLLLDNVEVTNYFRHGIYWCSTHAFERESISPLVEDLARGVGTNFQMVGIQGFDELFAGEFWGRYQQLGSIPRILSSTQISQQAGSHPPTLDMEPVTEARMNEELDWPTLRTRVINYCQKLDVHLPSPVDRPWLLERLIRQNLATLDDCGQPRPTNAGYLLFARKPQERLKHSIIRISIRGASDWLQEILEPEESSSFEESGMSDLAESERIIEGNLWSQYNSITEVLAVFNRPFRLKGEVSDLVYPFPPLALKEVIVNALVHRDYGDKNPISITIEPAFIRIMNPGGLVDEVRRIVGEDSIEREIRSGRRGIKGYRNPVIADLFYGAGTMDKRGSGLADVFEKVLENGGDLHFGPNSDNSVFEVTIYSRPEAVDRITNTASPVTVTTTRFAGNLLEVCELPKNLWHAETACRKGGDVFKLCENRWLPPFEIYGSRLFSFSDLRDQENPLHIACEPGTAEALSSEEFAGNQADDRQLVRLLNLSLKKHLEYRGLVVDLKRRRTYFPRTESNSGVRQITYQARLRRATRTVVKPRKRSSSDHIIYWEHKALSFRFERFDNTWGVFLLPGYVFTWDGEKGLLAPERVNTLSTRRASRDYNNNVHADLVFWLSVLAPNEESSFSLQVVPVEESDQYGDSTYRPSQTENISLLRSYPTSQIHDVELAESASTQEVFREDLSWLDRELAELAEEAQASEHAGEGNVSNGS